MINWNVQLRKWCHTLKSLTVYFLYVLVHLVDIWNMIEAFRDNGLNTLDHTTEISVSRLETVISSIYYQLNKRLPSTHQISVEQSISLLLNFMIAAYDRLVPYKLKDHFNNTYLFFFHSALPRVVKLDSWLKGKLSRISPFWDWSTVTDCLGMSCIKLCNSIKNHNTLDILFGKILVTLI